MPLTIVHVPCRVLLDVNKSFSAQAQRNKRFARGNVAQNRAPTERPRQSAAARSSHESELSPSEDSSLQDLD
jgi:hypothetical protein